MDVVFKSIPGSGRAMWLAVALAVLASATYLSIARGMLAVGDLGIGEKPPVIIYVAAGCYLAGGLLILVHSRWLWIVGAVINALVVEFFFNMYQHRPAVVFSQGGLVTKAAQLMLEAILIYLILSDRLPRSRHAGR